MYKVKPGDIIPTRTPVEAQALDAMLNGLITPFDKDQPVINKLFKQLERLSAKRDNGVKVVAKILEIVDTFYRRASTYSVCAKGCAHCCKVDVSVSKAEAFYMSRVIPKKIIKRAKARGANNGYCPFLDTDTALCTIRDFRPLACRALYVFDDPELCIDPNTSHTMTVDGSNYAGAPIERLVKYIISCGGVEAAEVKDIREWVHER